MKSKKSVRNSGGGNATSTASGSRDRSGGMASSRVGSSKDSSIRHASNRPMSSSPSRLAGESHYQQRSANYHNQQQGGDSNLAASGSSSVADGVYSNKRLMHACTCLIGTTVQVETIDGNVHEGLFRIFSPELEITLEQAHLIDPKSPTTITCEAVKEIMIFEMKEVLHMSAIGVDLDYAAKDGFQTDTQISSKNNGEGGVGGGSNFRELKEFEFDDTFSMNDEGLEGSFSMEKDRALEDGSNGWRAEDMFSMNEKKYGVQTSYKENLEGYTVQLKQSEKSSDEYRNREARAERLAREIEGTQASHLAAELENGDDDEESAFSAVQRGPSQKTDVRDSDTGGKYMPPARRQSNSGSNSGSMPSKQHPNSGPNTPQASTAQRTSMYRPSFRQPLYRQVSQGSGDRASLAEPKKRGDQMSDLQNFKKNFVLDDAGTSANANPAIESRGISDRAGYTQQQFTGQSNAVVSVSANPAGARDQHSKQSSPKQNTPAGPSSHMGHHQGSYSHQAQETHMTGNRVHSRSPPTPSTSSKGSSPPSLASINADSTTSIQNSKRFSPSQASGSNIDTPSTIPEASIANKQSIDGSGMARVDTRTPPTPTVTVPAVPPDLSNLSLSSGIVSSTSSSSESASTFAAGGSALPSANTSSAANVAKKSTLNPNAKEFVLNPSAKAFVPAASFPATAPASSVHRPPNAITPQQSYPQRSITPGQTVPGQAHQAVAVQYNTHPAPHFQMHPNAGPNFSAVSVAQGSPSVATVQQSHPQMQGQLIQYIHNPAAYAAQAANSHLAAQGVVQQVQGNHVPGQGPINAQGSGAQQSYGAPQPYGIPGGSPATAGPPPHNSPAQQQQVALQARYPRNGPGNGGQNASQIPQAMQQSSQPNQQRVQGQSANETSSPNVLAATGQPLLAPLNNQTQGGIQDSQQPNITGLNYQMFNPQIAAAHLIQATNPAGATSVMMRLPNGTVMPIASSMAQISANSAALQQAAQQAQASAATGIPPPQPGSLQQQPGDQTQQNPGPGSLPPPGGMSLPSPGGNVVTWVPQHHGAQPPSVMPGPPPPTSGIAPQSHPSGQPPQNQPPPPSSAGPPLPLHGQQQGGGQVTPAPSPGPNMMYSVQPPGGIPQAQGAPAHHSQGNAQSLHFAANYHSGPGVLVLPPNHASAGMHAIHHQTIMSQAGSMPLQSSNGQPITSMGGVMPPPIHHYMQHQTGVQGGVPGQHNPPPSILYPVGAHAMNAAAVQQHQAAAATAVQQQQSAQPPTPGAQ